MYECESCNDCFLRGKCFKCKNNKRIEYYLLVLAFNINKLHNRIQKCRFGKHLFEMAT